ncbi:hypothetical protein DNTS_011100, partial [Danionella cerebrum]
MFAFLGLAVYLLRGRNVSTSSSCRTEKIDGQPPSDNVSDGQKGNKERIEVPCERSGASVSETSNVDVPKAKTDCQTPGSCDEVPKENTGESEDLGKYIAANREFKKRYIIGRTLGSGANGVVYLATRVVDGAQHSERVGGSLMLSAEAVCTFEDTEEKRSRNRNIWIEASHKEWLQFPSLKSKLLLRKVVSTTAERVLSSQWSRRGMACHEEVKYCTIRRERERETEHPSANTLTPSHSPQLDEHLTAPERVPSLCSEVRDDDDDDQ